MFDGTHDCLNIQWSDYDSTKVKEEDFLTITVSGMQYETLRSTLERFPKTLLGDRKERMKYYVRSRNTYFFDRCLQSFDSILYYYQSGGILTRPPNIPMSVFEDEVLFFKLGKDVLLKLHKEEGFIIHDGTEVDKPSAERTLRTRVWELMEYPDSSSCARFVSFVSMFIIGLSITFFCLETLPVFAKQPSTRAGFSAVELACVVWFTFEYVIRFLASPSRCRFFWTFLNMVDLVAIVPYFVVLFMDQGGVIKATPLSVLRIVRLVRVFRIFKLSRHSMSLQILGNTLKHSRRELGMMIFFLFLGVLVFSSAVYYSELASSTPFTSIPDAFWYSLVTMTTVGYGDHTPKTRFGRLIGGMCAITGVLTLALPVPVIVSNFEFFYKQDQLINASKKRSASKEKRCSFHHH